MVVVGVVMGVVMGFGWQMVVVGVELDELVVMEGVVPVGVVKLVVGVVVVVGVAVVVVGVAVLC